MSIRSQREGFSGMEGDSTGLKDVLSSQFLQQQPLVCREDSFICGIPHKNREADIPLGRDGNGAARSWPQGVLSEDTL